MFERHLRILGGWPNENRSKPAYYFISCDICKESTF